MAHFKRRRVSRRSRKRSKRIDTGVIRAKERALLSGAHPRNTWWKVLTKHQIPFEVDE